MLKWDSENRPVGYVVGGTAGEPQITKEWAYVGLAGKIAKGIKMGYDFIEIDAWTSAEMFEPELKSRIDQLRKSEENVNIGLHADVKMDLTLPFGMQWKINHDKLVTVTLGAAEVVNARFILFHTSTTPIPEFGTAAARQATAPLLAPNGQNLGQFVGEWEKRGEKFNLKEWVKIRFPKMFFSAMGSVADTDVVQELDKWGEVEKAENFDEKYHEKLEEAIKLKNVIENKVQQEINELDKQKRTVKNEEERKKIAGKMYYLEKHGFRDLYQKLDKEDKGLVEVDVGRKGVYYEGWEDTFKYWASQGSQGEEQNAYHIIAMWMYKNNDILWTDIAGNENPDSIVKEVDKFSGQITPRLRKMVAAVAAKYIQGHLNFGMYRFEDIDIKDKERKEELPKHTEIKKPELNEKEKKTSVYEYGKKHGVHIYIETPMHVGEREGDMKIMYATDHVKIVKAFHQYFGGANVSYIMDFEHLITNHINPGNEIKNLKEGDGKYITMIHVLPPRPIEGTHGIIRMLSRDMFVIYSWLYNLRKKGMKNAYFIWEVGSDPGVYESPPVLRRMKEFLLKDVAPKELPAKFFGIDKAFEAEQRRTILSHALDPIEGLFTIPEEGHTALGKAATDKGKAEVWKTKKYT